MNKTQKGFTLVELMVSSVIGLIALSSVIMVFAVSVKHSSDGLKRIKLGQELRTIMDVMVRDIRRSGYWQGATGLVANPYTTLAVSADAKCITYSYDLNANATPQNADMFGFRFDQSGVKYRGAGATCNTTNGWTFISDTALITITNLTFGAVIICENLSDDDDDDTCSTAAADDVLSRRLNIDIVLSAVLKNDTAMTYSLNDSVTIRNAVPSLNGTF